MSDTMEPLAAATSRLTVARIWAEWLRCWSELDDDDPGADDRELDERRDVLFDQLGDCERAMVTTPAASWCEVVYKLRVVRRISEFATEVGCERTDGLDRLAADQHRGRRAGAVASDLTPWTGRAEPATLDTGREVP